MSGNVRSSHRRCFARRSVLRNFAKSTGKHLRQSFFFNKIADQPFLQKTFGQLIQKCLNKKISKWKWWTKLLFWKSNRLMFWHAKLKCYFFFICFHTQWEVFFQIKFHLGMKFYLFHPGMKLTCKQKFFHPRTSFIPGWDLVLVTWKGTLSYIVISVSRSSAFYLSNI